MIEIVRIEPTPPRRRRHRPMRELRYLNAARRGGTEVRRLPVLRSLVRGLPESVDAIVAASDLQGIVPDPDTREATLLGVAVAEMLEQLALVSAMRTGVVLAGDLFSVPEADQRGGHGSVATVWDAFASRFAWVVGVAGNHDDVRGVRSDERVALLDADTREMEGIRFGGVGLIAGDSAKTGRRDEHDQLERIELVAMESPHVLVLHEGPSGDRKQPGHPGIREILDRHPVPLTICGHVHWVEPLAQLARGQVLNVDTRVVLLTRA